MINGRYIAAAYGTGMFGPGSKIDDKTLRDYTEAIIRECAKIAGAAVLTGEDPEVAIVNYYEIK